jgi:hypothetical protein
VLVGQAGRYGVVRNGTARDPLTRWVEPAALGALRDG